MASIAQPLAPFITHPAIHQPLDAADRAAILALPVTMRMVEPLTYIVREGEPPSYCAVLTDGLAIRQKLTGNGARQILSLHVPGDPLDFQSMFLAAADHNVQALTRVELATIPRQAVKQLIEARPAVSRAVVVSLLVEASIGREWLLNVGRRDACTRLAHFLCEFALRIDAQWLRGESGYELPMSQEQLGDALGLTAVHVNRTLKALEQKGVLRRSGRKIVFPQWKQVRQMGDFSALYLHLGSGGLSAAAA